MANNIDVGKINWEITANADSAKKSVSGLSKEVKSLNKIFNLFKPLAFITALKGIGTHLGNLVMKEAEFIQTQNLFNKVMGDSISKATEFRDRMEGELGFNPSEIMKSMSAFKQLTDSFGLTNDEAYLMSKNLTQLAADLTAYGYSFENAMQKLKSGLAGEIEPMRAIGVALDKNTLQQTAYSLGIDKTIDSMTRAQKTELLYYQIMESTRKMRGELGRTMLSPANATRIMQQEFTQLGRAIGSIFIPLMMQIIPVVRAVTQILTEAAKAIAKFFGFDIGDFTYKMADADISLGGISDGLDDVADSASTANKEMQKMLMPFDELNNINLPKGSSSGSGTDLFGGGSLGIDLPKYDIFKTITGNMNKEVDKWKAKIEELIPVFKAVGIAAAAIWGTAKIMNFMVWLDKVRNAFSGLGALGTGVKVAFDLAFIIGGVWAQWQGTKKLLNGDFSLWTILETLGGTALGTFGIVKVLRDTGLGKDLGLRRQINLGLGIMLAIQSIQTIADGIKNGDIKKQIFGAIEAGLATTGIAFAFGVKGLPLLKLSVGATLLITGIESVVASAKAGAEKDLGNQLASVSASALSGMGIGAMFGGPIGAAFGGIAGATAALAPTAIEGFSKLKDAISGANEEIQSSTRVSIKDLREMGYEIDKLEPLGNNMGEVLKQVKAARKDLAEKFVINYDTDSFHELSEHLDELRESYWHLKVSMAESTEAKLAEMDINKSYVDDLGKLVDENGYVLDSDKERVNFILSQLNPVLGTQYQLDGNLIKTKDEQVISSQKLQEELNNEIELRKKQIEQEINLALYTEAAKQRAQVQKEITDKTRERSEAQKELTELEEQGISKTSEVYKNLQQKIAETDIALEDLQLLNKEASSDMVYYWGEAYQNISSDMLDMSEENAEGLQALLTNNYEAWDKAFGQLDESQQKTMLMMSTTIDTWTPQMQQKWEDLAGKGDEEFDKAYVQMKKDAGTFMTEYPKQIDQATLTEKMRRTASSMWKSWRDNLKLKDTIKEQMDSAKTGIDTEKTSVLNKIQGLTKDMASSLKVDMGGYGVGSNLVKGIADGINAVKNSTYLINSLSGLASKIGSSIRGFLGIHSPSTVMRDTVGKYIPLGIAEGIDMEADSITESMKDISERIQLDSQNFDSYLNPTFNPNINSNYTGKMEMSSDMSQGFEEATYNAMAKAIADSMSNQELSPYFNVYVGNDKLYSGYGKQQNRESNMYGIRV